MRFLMEQVRNLISAGVIMACAAGGTIGMIKVIRRFAPEEMFPPKRKRPEDGEKGGGQV